MSWEGFGEWMNLSLILAFFSAIFWLAWRKRRAKRRGAPVPDGPADAPYQVYTKKFDCEFAGHEIDHALLRVSPDYASGWFKLGKDRWRNEIHLADQLFEAHRASFQQALGDISALKGHALTFLVDQSGSMEGEPMRWTAICCRLAAEYLEQAGCSVEVLGYSTAGWRGGFAYQKWQNEGRPRRPGRLCALLHIVYKAHMQPTLERTDWEAMLNPNTLRENVDGEALEWAAERLRSVECRKRHLIILSDGAPVDDATLTHNGVSYLARHLKSVIATLERDKRIELSAIGVRYAVSDYYDQSTKIDDLPQLPTGFAQCLKRIVSANDTMSAG